MQSYPCMNFIGHSLLLCFISYQLKVVGGRHPLGMWVGLTSLVVPDALVSVQLQKVNILEVFCIERKIDLTSYINWWGTNNIRRTSSLPKPSDETKHGPKDIGGEMKILELCFQPTEPYQMPHLGLSHGGKKHQGSAVSALSILSRAAAYKSLQEKASKEQNEEGNNHETWIKEMEPNKVIQESTSGDGGSERLGVTLGMNWLSFQRPVSPLSTFLSTPLLTNYNTMDPLADPILWTNLVSFPMTSGLSLPTEVTKTEATSTYTCFHPEPEE